MPIKPLTDKLEFYFEIFIPMKASTKKYFAAIIKNKSKKINIQFFKDLLFFKDSLSSISAALKEFLPLLPKKYKFLIQDLIDCSLRLHVILSKLHIDEIIAEKNTIFFLFDQIDSLLRISLSSFKK